MKAVQNVRFVFDCPALMPQTASWHEFGVYTGMNVRTHAAWRWTEITSVKFPARSLPEIESITTDK